MGTSAILPLVIAILGAGGVVGAISAWRKVQPERESIIITAAQGALVIQAGVLEKLQEELERAHEQIAELRTEVEAVNDELHAEVDQLRGERDALLEENSDLREKVTQLEQRVHELEHARSNE